MVQTSDLFKVSIWKSLNRFRTQFWELQLSFCGSGSILSWIGFSKLEIRYRNFEHNLTVSGFLEDSELKFWQLTQRLDRSSGNLVIIFQSFQCLKGELVEHNAYFSYGTFSVGFTLMNILGPQCILYKHRKCFIKFLSLVTLLRSALIRSLHVPTSLSSKKQQSVDKSSHSIHTMLIFSRNLPETQKK